MSSPSLPSTEPGIAASEVVPQGKSLAYGSPDLAVSRSCLKSKVLSVAAVSAIYSIRKKTRHGQLTGNAGTGSGL